MDNQLALYIAVDITGILGMIFIFFSIGLHPSQKGPREKQLLTLMVTFIVVAASDMTVRCYDSLSPALLEGAFVLKLLAGNGVMLSFVSFLRAELELLPEQWKAGTRNIRAAGIAMGLLMLLNPWHGLFRPVPPGQRTDGGSFWLLCVYYCLTLGASLYQILIHREIRWQRRLALALFCLLHIVTVIAQPFLSDLPLMTLASLLSILVISSNFYAEQNRKFAQQTLELQATRAALVLSQIQPHFLFNSMATVMDLCDTDPWEAKAALQELSDYLHYKISALSGNFLVGFDEDMEFLQSYLRLEKRRFGPRLNVEYEIGATDFKVPLLTLQPLAENAIRHGLSKRPDGGTLRIITKEIAEYYSILVEDNGVGFDTSAPCDSPGNHVGLNNVRTRLSILCHGSLTVRSMPGVGTIVEITIRKKEEEPHYENSRRR